MKRQRGLEPSGHVQEEALGEVQGCNQPKQGQAFTMGVQRSRSSWHSTPLSTTYTQSYTQSHTLVHSCTQSHAHAVHTAWWRGARQTWSALRSDSVWGGLNTGGRVAEVSGQPGSAVSTHRPALAVRERQAWGGEGFPASACSPPLGVSPSITSPPPPPFPEISPHCSLPAWRVQSPFPRTTLQAP